MYSNWNNVFVFWYCKIKLLFKTESTVKPVLNGISRDQNIFPLKPGFPLIKLHYLYKN